MAKTATADPDEEPQEPEAPDDGGEAKFWERFGTESEAAYERVLSKLSAQVDAEAEDKPEKPTRKAPAKVEKPEEEQDDDGGTAPEEPTEAQRQRERGRVGPASESPYWERARKYIYGRNR